MTNTTRAYTVEQILQDLGYPDLVQAARQQARMILLGRLARYEAAIQELVAATGGSTLEVMREQYTAEGKEDPAMDDAYLTWQWHDDAISVVKAQLAVLANS